MHTPVKDKFSWIVSINIDKEQRGKGYASKILREASGYFFHNVAEEPLFALIKKSNIASEKIFRKAGFKFEKCMLINKIDSVQYKLSIDDFSKVS